MTEWGSLPGHHFLLLIVAYNARDRIWIIPLPKYYRDRQFKNATELRCYEIGVYSSRSVERKAKSHFAVSTLSIGSDLLDSKADLGPELPDCPSLFFVQKCPVNMHDLDSLFAPQVCWSRLDCHFRTEIALGSRLSWSSTEF